MAEQTTNEQLVYLPFATVLGGRTQQIDLKVVFTYTPESREQIVYRAILGSIPDNKAAGEFDFSHMIETHGHAITKLVWENKDVWNTNHMWFRSPDKSFKLV